MDLQDQTGQPQKKKAPKTNDDRLQLLKSRLSVAKQWCKKPHEAWKKWMAEYNIEDWDDTAEIRDKVRIGYLFRKAESELPSIFDDQPDVFIRGRHADTRVIEPLIDGTYDYLWDIQHLEETIENIGLDFEVLGMGFIESPWVTKTKKVMQQVEQPVTDPATGQPQIDPGTGQPITQVVQQAMDVPIIDNPMAKRLNPFKLFFSPETKFNAVLDYEHCPYYFYEELTTVDEIEDTYGVTVEANETLKVDDTDVDNFLQSDKSVVTDDLKRVTKYHYWGCLPKEMAKGIKDENGQPIEWSYDKEYHIVLTKNEELLVEECPYDSKPLFVLGGYGSGDKFFKFGEAKHLMPLIQEFQMYRTLILQHLRKNANPKALISTTSNVDEAAFRDPRAGGVVKFDGQTPPTYLTPPPLSQEVNGAIEIVRTDLEKTAGSFDLANGSGQSTVKSPRGIAVYSEAADRNTVRKRKKVARLIRELLIFQFNQLAQNWKPEDGKTLSVIAPPQTDPATGQTMPGGPQQTQVTAEVLQVLSGINIMYQLDIEVESLSLNKAQMKSDAVELWDRAAAHPDIFNLQELAKDMLQNGYGKKDADRFLISPEQAAQAASAAPKPSVSLSIKADSNTPVGMTILEKEGILSPQDVQMAQAQNLAIANVQNQQMLPPGQTPGQPTTTQPQQQGGGFNGGQSSQGQ